MQRKERRSHRSNLVAEERACYGGEIKGWRFVPAVVNVRMQ